LSTLTKVLIVLLTVFSLFLCGTVVTYVANADNQKKKADGLQQQLQSARQRQQSAIASEEQQKQESEALKADMGKQLNDLNTLRTQLEAQIDGLKRENGQLVQKLTDMAAVVETANATASHQTELFQNSQQEVQSLRAEQTNRNKELQETTQALMERMAVLTDLEKRNRQLIEEKQGLETQLTQVLQQYGRAPLRPQTVTTPRTTAQPIQRASSQQLTQAPQAQTRPINLNGRITQVDLKNKVAAISIGAAAGVRGDMKFHVTRGDRFVCDILIFDVDPEKAIGTLDLVQVEPQPGDSVTTNL
jgi:chromosome segregation ATPase